MGRSIRLYGQDRNPTPLLTVEFIGEHNRGALPSGRFTQTLSGTRIRVNMSSDLSVDSYLQYDTVSDSLGMNTRLRWTFRPEGDLFVVYNHTCGPWWTDGNSTRTSW